jgi:hypothetical protein
MTTKKKAKARRQKPAMAGSKKARLIKMLETKGATLDAICKKFTWQRHTARAVVSTLGNTNKIESTRDEKGARFYRITKS